MKAIEQLFQVVLFNYAVQGGSNFSESVNETQVCNHLNENYWAVL